MKIQIMSPVSDRFDRRPTEVVALDLEDSSEAFEQLNQHLTELDWNDGSPCYAATPAKVERMLKGTRRHPQDVIMVMEPGFGLATVEKIAVNAVMAGCRPEHMPILIAAIQALADPKSDHLGFQVSSHTEAPMLLINGPIAQRAGIYSDVCAMGPGVVNQANTAVAKALRLCLTNIGHCRPGVEDVNFIGVPTKYGMVIAENEETSPWDPYHVDLGYRREQSVVTLVTVTGPLDLGAGGDGPESILDGIGDCMGYRFSHAGAWLRGRSSVQVGKTEQRAEFQGPYHPILLSPNLAVVLANAGYSRKKAQDYLFNKVRVPLKKAALGMKKDAAGRWLAHPELQHLENDPGATVPALESPDQYLLFATGGIASRGNFFFGVYGIAHQVIEDR